MTYWNNNNDEQIGNTFKTKINLYYFPKQFLFHTYLVFELLQEKQYGCTKTSFTYFIAFIIALISIPCTSKMFITFLANLHFLTLQSTLSCITSRGCIYRLHMSFLNANSTSFHLHLYVHFRKETFSLHVTGKTK